MQTIDTKQLWEEYEKLSGDVCLVGWIRSNRDSGTIGFISFNDGSSLKPIQIVYKSQTTKGFDEAKSARTSAAVLIIGELKLTPKGKQPFEIAAKQIKLLKQSDENYPLQKKKHSNEYLRTISHLRPRTNLFSATMKVRSQLAFAVHQFFNENNFVWVSTPILTGNDAEGAGENFKLAKMNDTEFFNKPTSLTVTGQLHAEAYAQAFKKVYTFGPTFRAEKSHTNRHMAEFWMIEPEIAFADINQIMSIMEVMLKAIIENYFEHCKEEIDFFNTWIDKESKARIEALLKANFQRMEYRDAIVKLTEVVKKGHKFEDNNIKFGMDLASEHERYLCEEVVKGPLFLYNYPKDIKAFYMKANSDGETVAAVDLLVPGVGELAGGSQREESYEKLLKRCQELDIDTEQLAWYIDLRKYGYYQSSGFGLGFERLIMYITGITNIRDVIPFPRNHGNLLF